MISYLKYLYVALLVAIAGLALGCSGNSFSSATSPVSKNSSQGTVGGSTTTTTTPPGTVPVSSCNGGNETTITAAYPCPDSNDNDNGCHGYDSNEIASAYDTSDDGKKVYVCHVPGGNPSNAHNICVSIHSFPAHASAIAGDADEDYFGPCKPATPNPTGSPVPAG